MIKGLKSEAGYTLVEVMVSIVLLTITIIPIFSMFDSGLKSATLGSNYDKGRALANLKLEQAKNLPYDTVRTNFPSEATGGNGAPGASGNITSSSVTPAQDSQVPNNFSYTVTKQYLVQPTVAPSSSSENVGTSNSATDTKVLKVTVTVSWSGGSYTTSGVVTG